MGNLLADATAKKAALTSLDFSSTVACVSESLPIPASLDHLVDAQRVASVSEHRVWSTDSAGVWRHMDGRPICPCSILPYLVRLQHGPAHAGQEGVSSAINEEWLAPGVHALARQIHSTSVTYQQYNIGQSAATQPGSHPPPWGSFIHIQIDFIQRPKCCSYEYVLVLVCMYNGWVKAYPCAKS